ncbi:unnamed protein product, partial [Ixodes hexagonus]
MDLDVRREQHLPRKKGKSRRAQKQSPLKKEQGDTKDADRNEQRTGSVSDGQTPPLSDKNQGISPPKNKAASLMQQHRTAWQNEFQKLLDAEEKLKTDIVDKLREEPADWTEEDYAVVQHVLEQYPSQLANRRALVMDWLRRHYKKRSILDISAYMTWCQNQRFHREKVQSCLQEWERARVQWLAKAKQASKGTSPLQRIQAKPRAPPPIR